MDLEFEKLSSAEEVSEKGWFDIIPYELRSMVVDSMDTKSKCRFSICSKKCDEEVEMSGNGIERIWISKGFSSIAIHVKSGDFSRRLEFSEKLSNIVAVECLDMDSYETVREYKEVGTLFDVVLKYFDYFIKNGAKSLKELAINNEDLPLLQNRSIKHLKNLEKIKLPGDFDFDSGFCDFQQICGLKEDVVLKIPILSIDQLFQIKAEKIQLYGLKWTIPDINTFLKSCIDGKMKETVDYLYMEFDELILDEKIFEDLNIVEKRHWNGDDHYLFDYKYQSDWRLLVKVSKNWLLIRPRLYRNHNKFPNEEW